MAMTKPWPSTPTRFAAGTRTSSSTTSPVALPRRPILCSSFGTFTPQSASTRKHEIPRCPASGSVLAKTVYVSEIPALVTQYLVPDST